MICVAEGVNLHHGGFQSPAANDRVSCSSYGASKSSLLQVYSPMVQRLLLCVVKQNRISEKICIINWEGCGKMRSWPI
jgi:hypothetical protein